MKLFRLATLYYDGKLPVDWQSWVMNLGEVRVQTMGTWDVGERHRLLVVAEVALPGRPALTDQNLIVVPEGPRTLAEQAIEAAANLISVAEGRKRAIASPTPCVALVPEDADTWAWLKQARGFVTRRTAIPRFGFRVPAEIAQEALSDRLDGVALLAEALGHDHPTGQFHEFLRLFERAFRHSSSALVEPLTEFLEGAARQGFHRGEVESWLVRLRHPATHADVRPEFVLEGDIRPVIHRVEQAAYDVLLNKAKWRSPSAARRNAWTPVAGTSSPTKDLFVLRGTTPPPLESQMLDDFGSYPLDLSAGLSSLPEGWWSEDPMRSA